jgi:hypothetical protein
VYASSSGRSIYQSAGHVSATLNADPVVVQFAVAAVSDRRNLLNQKTAVRDRRYKESNCATTADPETLIPNPLI